jgi:hypothetical protein
MMAYERTVNPPSVRKPAQAAQTFDGSLMDRPESMKTPSPR